MIFRIVSFCVITCAIVTLLSLSAWQIKRLQWKNDIIDKLDLEYQKNPANYVYNFNALKKLYREETPIRYGQIKGLFLHDKTMLFGPKPHDKKPGYHVVTPLQLDSGIILVHRGWISDTHKDQLNRSVTSTALNGIMRKPEWNSFTPNNNVDNNVWTKLDIADIAQKKNVETIAPVIFYTETKTSEYIIPQSTKWYPRNKHKQYAIFWFIMACALISVLLIFKRQASQEQS